MINIFFFLNNSFSIPKYKISLRCKIFDKLDILMENQINDVKHLILFLYHYQLKII